MESKIMLILWGVVFIGGTFIVSFFKEINQKGAGSMDHTVCISSSLFCGFIAGSLPLSQLIVILVACSFMGCVVSAFIHYGIKITGKTFAPISVALAIASIGYLVGVRGMGSCPFSLLKFLIAIGVLGLGILVRYFYDKIRSKRVVSTNLTVL